MKLSKLIFGLLPALIICGEKVPRMASTHFTGHSHPAYCDVKSEPGTAWTLVMSWSFSNRHLSPFKGTPLKRNSPVNENAQNWNFYRLSLARMRSLQAHSTHWRVTCSYPTHGIDFRDYLRGNFENFNILDYVGSNGACKKVEFN